MTSRGRIVVLQFSNEPSVRGGAEEHMLKLARSLRPDCFRVVIACTPRLIEAFGADIPEHVAVEPIEFDNPKQIGQAKRFAAILRQHNVDLLHSHMFHSSLVASPLARICRVPVIIETTHVRENWRKGLKANYFIDRLVGRCVDYFIGVSSANGAYLRDTKKITPRKVKVIANGIDTDSFHPGHRAPAGMRDAIGCPGNDPVVTVLARLEPQKGHTVLLDALPSVCREFPRLQVVLLGDGTLREQLEAQARSLRLTNNVHFAGYQANTADWLALSAFTVLPSFYEGLPLGALESLSAGKTVVATAVDGTTEVVVDGQTGLTVPPGNPAALSAAICRLLNDPQLTQELGTAGRKWVLENFSHQRQMRETEELYLKAWQEKRGSAMAGVAACQSPS